MSVNIFKWRFAEVNAALEIFRLCLLIELKIRIPVSGLFFDNNTTSTGDSSFYTLLIFKNLLMNGKARPLSKIFTLFSIWNFL